MRKAFGDYQRIARGSLGMSSLWMGADHLLYIKGNGFLLPFSEEYKRFRYSDIQGLVLAPAPGLWLGALGYLAAFAAAAGLCFSLLFFREPGDTRMLALTLALPLPVAVLLLALLIRHLILGPLCLCEVQTGVKRERLRPVNRLHRGRELLDVLGDRVRAAQSGLQSPAEMPATAPPPGREDALHIPAAAWPAFGLPLAAGALLLTLLHLPSNLVSAVALALLPCGLIALIIALAGSVRHLCPEPVRQTLWFQLATVLILGAVTAVYLIDQAISDPAVTLDFLGPIGAFADIRALGGRAFYLVFLVSGIANLAAAAAGLALCSRWLGRIRGAIPIQQGQVSDHTLS